MYPISYIDLLQNLYADLKAGKYCIRLKKKRNNNKAKTIEKSKDKLIITAPFNVKFFTNQG